MQTGAVWDGSSSSWAAVGGSKVSCSTRQPSIYTEVVEYYYPANGSAWVQLPGYGYGGSANSFGIGRIIHTQGYCEGPGWWNSQAYVYSSAVGYWEGPYPGAVEHNAYGTPASCQWGVPAAN